MPTNVVKTAEQERLWNKAKARAAEEGRAGDYAYIMGIFKRMGGLNKSMVAPPFRGKRIPGQVPSREGLEALKVAQTPPRPMSAQRLLDHGQDPRPTIESIVRGLGFTQQEETEWKSYLTHALATSANEVVLARSFMDKARDLDPVLRNALYQRVRRYRKDQQAMTKSGPVQIVRPEDVLGKSQGDLFRNPKARPASKPSTGSGGPYRGPKGGLWADAAHTIPWKGGPKGQTSLLGDEKNVTKEQHERPAIEGMIKRQSKGFDRAMGEWKAASKQASNPAAYQALAQAETMAKNLVDLYNKLGNGDKAKAWGKVARKARQMKLDAHRAYQRAQKSETEDDGMDVLAYNLVTDEYELHKALYIGPRGGKWADPQHTIPYDPAKHGPKATGKKIFIVDKTALGKPKARAPAKAKGAVTGKGAHKGKASKVSADKDKPAPKAKPKQVFVIDKTKDKPKPTSTQVLGEEQASGGTSSTQKVAQASPTPKPKAGPTKADQMDMFTLMTSPTQRETPKPAPEPEPAPAEDEPHTKPLEEQEPGWDRMPDEQKKKGTKASKTETIHREDFLEWFGDWTKGEGSKVVNASGEPQEEYGNKPVKVFHGTAVGGFTSFDPNKVGKYNIYGPGFYFTEDYGIAKEYTEKDNEDAIAATTHFERDGEKIEFMTTAQARKVRELAGSTINPNWDRNVLHALDVAADAKGRVNLDEFLQAFWNPDVPEVDPSDWQARQEQPRLGVGAQGGKVMVGYLLKAMKLPKSAAIYPEPEVFETFLNIRKPLDMDVEVPREEMKRFQTFLVAKTRADLERRIKTLEANIEKNQKFADDSYASAKRHADDAEFAAQEKEFADRSMTQVAQDKEYIQAIKNRLKEIDSGAEDPALTASVFLKQILNLFDEKTGDANGKFGDFGALAKHFPKGFDPDSQTIPVGYKELLAVKQYLVEKYKGQTYDDQQIFPLLFKTDPDVLTWGDVQYILSDSQDYQRETLNLIEWAKSEGYDGIHHTGGWNVGSKDHDVWIAWEPNQVKASNARVFNPDSDDMYNGDTESEAGWERMPASDVQGEFFGEMDPPKGWSIAGQAKDATSVKAPLPIYQRDMPDGTTVRMTGTIRKHPQRGYLLEMKVRDHDKDNTVHLEPVSLSGTTPGEIARQAADAMHKVLYATETTYGLHEPPKAKPKPKLTAKVGGTAKPEPPKSPATSKPTPAQKPKAKPKLTLTPPKAKPKAKRKSGKKGSRKTKAVEQGEHVWGSRKDLAVTSSSDLDALNPDEQAKLVTKAKIMPKWDPDELLGADVDPEAIVLRRAVEKAVRAKPGNSLEERKAYIDGVDFLSRSLDSCKTEGDIFDMLNDWDNLAAGRSRKAVYTEPELEQILDEYATSKGEPPKMPWAERKALKDAYEAMVPAIKAAKEAREAGTMTTAEWNVLAGEYNEKYRKYRAAKPGVSAISAIRWKLDLDDTSSSINYLPTGQVVFYHHDSKLRATIAQEGNEYRQFMKALGPNMEKLVQTGGLGQVYKGFKTIRPPKAFTDAARQAEKIRAMESDEDKIAAMEAAMQSKRKGGKRRAPFRFERNVPGEIDRVGGTEVMEGDPKVFAETFGLANVQFGDWVADEEAESHLRGAHGAFLDLADILGVDPKAVSLNGRLALGIGARGSGGARAHYESAQRIINITKIAGGGSLAHEWAHAMDNILSVAADPSNTKARRFVSDNEAEGVDLEVRKAFQKVMDLINHGEEKLDPDMAEAKAAYEEFKGVKNVPYQVRRQIAMYKRYKQAGLVPKSKYLADAEALGRGGYWVRPQELFARAFESFIEDTLTEQGRRSSYLVSGTQVSYATGRASEGGNPEAQPYPRGDERKAINAAMKVLVQAVQKSKSLEKAIRFLMDLEKAAPRGGRYYRRVAKGDGKGHRYYYKPEDYHKREDAHVSGAEALKSTISRKVAKCIAKAGKNGCDVAHFSELAKKYGAHQVKAALKAGCEGGSLEFKKGRFYTKCREA